ncbi:type VI secretion system lipoprotein TssJ [Pseudomonas batumici]|uniref:Type VI secretion lipoprotein/VasD n=1 Tax=Pseudomonas batumici TaxID=226910 RepID=A0A0C2IG22_9PSED|nr:type VI secretion system lipoprotein TssJ [Pseudomonas batumici]KIH85995.1 Type VI secretion lipoprotein/VasD [Pseudomonas batumici]
MVAIKQVFRHAMFLLLVLTLPGCTWFWADEPAPPEPRIALSLEAALDSNPDLHGRPSPVIVRLLQLADSKRLEQVELFQSEAAAEQALGRDLLRQESLLLRPGQQQQQGFIPEPGTRFVAIVAEYRNIDHAQWWAWAEIDPTRSSRLTALIGRERVVLTSAPAEEKADE